MQKIKDMLKQIGASDEAADAIVETMVDYQRTVKEGYAKEFRGRLERAKEVMLEKFDAYKASLARKVGVFLESKARSIEEASQRQLQNEDTEATNTLKRARALLEGVDIESGDSRELQASKRTNERLLSQMQALKEERGLILQKANRANEIATQSLRRNRLLEEALQEVGVTLHEDGRVERKSLQEEDKKDEKKEDEKEDKDSKDEKKDKEAVKEGYHDREGRLVPEAGMYCDDDYEDDWKRGDRDLDLDLGDEYEDEGLDDEYRDRGLDREYHDEYDDKYGLGESRDRKGRRKLDEGRSVPARPATTRRSLNEDKKQGRSSSDPSIMRIAETLDD